MSLDSRDRFTQTADRYRRFRPSYPAALIDWIGRTAGLGPRAVVVDAGCGTGISTRLFAERGHDAIGVDPNEAMLAHARKEGGARFVRGEAAATSLADSSADLVIAAQAFHWFDVGPTLAEFRRILRPRGWMAAFWNVRASSPVMDEYEALLRRTSPDYVAIPNPRDTIAALRARPELTDVRETEFPNGQPLDREAFDGRVWSSSYVMHGVADREAFQRDLDALFARHARDGIVEFVYRAISIAGRLRSLRDET